MAGTSGPNLVDTGLILAFDAADRNSYPGSGTTWTDLSSSGNNGTLRNSPTYSSDNGGSIVFDGINDRIDIANTVLSGTQNFTIEAICRSSAANTAEYIFGNYGAGNTNGVELYFSSNTLVLYYGNTYMYSPNNSISSNVWYSVTATRNGNNVALYINGTLSSSGTNTDSIATNNPYTIGNGYDYSYEIFVGNISLVRVYNRALTSTEIQQNFNEIRSRFGI